MAFPKIVIRHHPFEDRELVLIDVVIDDVHDDPDPLFVASGHQGLAIFDPGIGIMDIAGITPFGDEVLSRVIAPVIGIVGPEFIDGLVIVDRQKLKMGDA